MPLNFDLVEVNPNDTTGGGGTLSAEMHDADAVGPYFVWPATEMDSAISPAVVVAASEVDLMAAKLAQYREGSLAPLAGGERETPVVAVTQDTGAGRGPESEEYDFSDPDAFARAAAFARGE